MRSHIISFNLLNSIQLEDLSEEKNNIFIFADSDVIVQTPQSTAAFQYLRNNVGTYEEQADNWRQCLRERVAYLEAHSIYEYLLLFPALRVQYGHKLLLQDFNDNYPEKKNALYSVWPHLALAILKIAVGKGDLYESVLEDVNGM